MKLTLDIDNNLVADIEKYAGLRGQDISTIVENYFYTIVGTNLADKNVVTKGRSWQTDKHEDYTTVVQVLQSMSKKDTEAVESLFAPYRFSFKDFKFDRDDANDYE
jgi:hypothetical protein